MFIWSFVIQRVNGPSGRNMCTPDLYNESLNNMLYCQQSVSPSSICLPLSLLAFLLNLYCFVRFAQLPTGKRSVMRLNLKFLTASEFLFHLCLTLDHIHILTGVCLGHTRPITRLPQITATTVSAIGADIFLCCRNWCHALITASRAEAVQRPLRIRRWFSRRNVALIYGLILTISTVMALLRSLAEQLIVCDQQPAGGLPTFALLKNYLLGRSDYDIFDTYIFFCFQTVIPVISVLVFSTLIVMGICPWRESRKRRTKKTTTAGDGDQKQQNDNNSNFENYRHSLMSAATGQRHRNQVKATRTALLLAVVFTLMEMPTFLMKLLVSYLGVFELTGIASRIAINLCEVLLILESLLNTLVFMSNESVLNLRSILRCKNPHAQDKRRGLVQQSTISFCERQGSVRRDPGHKLQAQHGTHLSLPNSRNQQAEFV